MIKSQKKLKNLEELLNKNDAALTVRAIEMLREDEPFEGAVSLLASCYDSDPGSLVQKAIEEFMNDLKDQDLCPEVISEIKKERKSQTVSMLVSSCWQSGLDYSAYLPDLAEVFIRSDYEVAIECFTVIEESVHVLNKSEKHRIAAILGNSAAGVNDTKKALTAGLLLELS